MFTWKDKAKLWAQLYSIIHSHPPGMTLTNANRQRLRDVPWTSHSALILSTLALSVTAEGEYCSPITNSVFIHLLPVVARHQLALWVVPLYWSGHSTCVVHTEHSLISHPDGQRHVRLWAIQASAAILQVSSRHCERRWQEEQLYDREVKSNKQML